MKKILAIVASFAIVAFNGVMLFDSTPASAEYDFGPGAGPYSCNYNVTLDVTKEIALDCIQTDVAMSPTIPGMTGGGATGTRACKVYTNSSDGWTLSAKAASSSAMQGTPTGDAVGHSFANISAGATLACSAGSSCFGASTGTGWYFPLLTSDTVVNEGSTHNATIGAWGGGTETTMTYEAVVTHDANQPSGPYVAQITMTAAVK